MDFGVALVAGSQAAEVVQVSEAALDDPALAAEPRAVLAATAGDHGFDRRALQSCATVLVVVIAAVGEQSIGLLARAATLAAHRPAVQSRAAGSAG